MKMCSTGSAFSENVLYRKYLLWKCVVQEEPLVKCVKYKKYPLWKCVVQKELISAWALSAHRGNYTAVLCFQADPLHSNRMWQNGWQLLYTACFQNNHHWSGAFTALFGRYMAGTMSNCWHLGAHSVYTIQPCTRLQWLFQATYVVYTCVCRNMLPALLAEWPASFTCYCSNRGLELIPK